jgi:hypothetical protein
VSASAAGASVDLILSFLVEKVKMLPEALRRNEDDVTHAPGTERDPFWVRRRVQHFDEWCPRH